MEHVDASLDDTYITL